MTRAKKITFIVLLLLLAIIIGYSLYMAFLGGGKILPTIIGPGATTTGGLVPAGPRGATTTGGPGAPTAGALPTAGAIPQATPGFYVPTPVDSLTTENVSYPSLSSAGDVRYHNPTDGKFYRIKSDGSIAALSNQIFYNVQKVTWAQNANKAVLEYPDGAKTIYNFDTNKQVPLPKHWENFSFSPDSTQLAAKSVGLSPENRWLITFNDDGTGTRAIEDLGENQDKVTVDWSPSRQVIAFSKTGNPLGADRQQILMVGLNHENFKGLTVEGLGFESKWSPTGQKLAYSVWSGRSDFEPELWIVNSYGDNINTGRKTIKLNTWAKKCSFGDDNTIFCAVPRTLPAGAGMSPSVNSSYDDFYKVDLRTGAKTLIPTGDVSYSATSIYYDKAGNRLVFTDLFKAGIFEAKLNQ